jgi:hypothetical protein
MNYTEGRLFLLLRKRRGSFMVMIFNRALTQPKIQFRNNKWFQRTQATVDRITNSHDI